LGIVYWVLDIEAHPPEGYFCLTGNVDMLDCSGVSENFRRRSEHVHETIIPCVWRLGLPFLRHGF
jgi:hypothetical protein